MAQALDPPLTCWGALGKVPNFQEIHLENREPQDFGVGEHKWEEEGAEDPRGGPQGRKERGMCLTLAKCQAWAQASLQRAGNARRRHG